MQLQQQVATELVAKSRIAAAPREWASLGMPKHNPPEKVPIPLGDPGPRLILGFGAHWVHTPNGISIGSAVIAVGQISNYHTFFLFPFPYFSSFCLNWMSFL